MRGLLFATVNVSAETSIVLVGIERTAIRAEGQVGCASGEIVQSALVVGAVKVTAETPAKVFCPRAMETGYEVAFDREIHGVGKAPEQRAADARTDVLILKGPCSNPFIRCEQLIEKRQPQPRFPALIPLVRCHDVEIDSRLGNQPILGHRCGFFRRSSRSRAEPARLGSRRYSASRSSASIRWDSGTGISPGFSEMLSQRACR